MPASEPEAPLDRTDREAAHDPATGAGSDMGEDAGPASGAPVEEAPISRTLLLIETTAIQALGTAAVLAVPTLAPRIAADLGVPASFVGYQVSLTYFFAMSFSIVAGPLVNSVGPCRTGQVAMLLNALGCIASSMTSIPAIAMGSAAIGAAYGLINPSASDLLSRHAPPHRRNLFFSIKQTGVPLGGLAIGLTGPSIAVNFGWGPALWLVALVSLALALALQPSRARLDAHRVPTRRLLRSSLQGLAMITNDRKLVFLTLSSFCFSAIQLCLLGFLVVLLVEEIGLGLVLAGGILATVQVAGAAGRVIWGQVADVTGSGLGVLAGLAAAMALGSALVALSGQDWPLWVLVLVLVSLGLTGVGWNGVYLSEIARLAPPGGVSAITGAAMVVTFAGVLFGPTIFSLVHTQLGSYTQSYWLLAATGIVGGALTLSTLARVRRAEQQ